jgi:hypothetical protein
MIDFPITAVNTVSARTVGYHTVTAVLAILIIISSILIIIMVPVLVIDGKQQYSIGRQTDKTDS